MSSNSNTHHQINNQINANNNNQTQSELIAAMQRNILNLPTSAPIVQNRSSLAHTQPISNQHNQQQRVQKRNQSNTSQSLSLNNTTASVEVNYRL